MGNVIVRVIIFLILIGVTLVVHYPRRLESENARADARIVDAYKNIWFHTNSQFVPIMCWGWLLFDSSTALPETFLKFLLLMALIFLPAFGCMFLLRHQAWLILAGKPTHFPVLEKLAASINPFFTFLVWPTIATIAVGIRLISPPKFDSFDAIWVSSMAVTITLLSAGRFLRERKKLPF